MINTTVRQLPVSARWLWFLGAIVIGGAAWAGADRWLPLLSGRMAAQSAEAHDDHGPEHAQHDANSIELSLQAQKNIGLELTEIKLQPFIRTITVPGIVVERPGRSTTEVTAPLTGVVTRIYALEGEAVEPSQPLFDLRLTHEELVQAQSDFLRTAEELDVIAQEVSRLEQVATNGAVAGKTVLERKYEQQKQQAVLRAQTQALILHGLSQDQIDRILADRTLLHTLTVQVPPEPTRGEPTGAARRLQLHSLQVEQGQHVEAGAKLCSLVDHAVLYIEGKAFEQDAAEVNQAAANRWTVSVVMESKGPKPEVIAGLDILYVAGEVNTESRDLHFYVTLPNKLLRESETDKRKFVYWRYKPGQRVRIRLPVERWESRIVLPVEAVAQDGAETFVFMPNGERFERRPVHVEYRDQYFVVIAADGSLYPGDLVVKSGARQLLLALKNQAGGGVDPHAGHDH